MKKGQHGGARPRTGPKAKPIGETRRNRLVLNFTDAEYEQLDRAAGEQEVGAYLRDVALRHMGRLRKKTRR